MRAHTIGMGTSALMVGTLGLLWFLSKRATEEPEPRHPVTQSMREQSKGMTKRRLAPFEYPDHAGKLTKFEKGPAVILTMLHDCPCTMEAQPIFNDLYAAFGSKVPFYGLCKDKPAEVKRFIELFKVQFPVLIDAQKKTLKELEATRSVYIALIGKDGDIEKVWPGYDRMMIADLATRLSNLSGLPIPPLVMNTVPNKPTAGCDL